VVEGPADRDEDEEVHGGGAGRGKVAELLADLAGDLERRDDDPDGPGLEERRDRVVPPKVRTVAPLVTEAPPLNPPAGRSVMSR
jgi:hypothetical protein